MRIRRQPIFFISLISLLATLVPMQLSAANVILIRHADKQPDCDKVNTRIVDCFDGTDDKKRPLSTRGKRRAKELRRALSHIELSAILHTDYVRSRETIEQLQCGRRCVKVEGDKRRTLDSVKELVQDHPSGTIVVCSHRGVMPSLLQDLCWKRVQIAEEDYDDMFIFFPGNKDGCTGFVHLEYGEDTED